MYGKKIRMIRDLKGYSQEFVALKLGIAQNTYSKIECKQHKLTTEMLQKIAEILEISSVDILHHDQLVVDFEEDSTSVKPIREIKNIYNSYRELYEQIIASKDAEIERMQKIIDLLLDRK